MAKTKIHQIVLKKAESLGGDRTVLFDNPESEEAYFLNTDSWKRLGEPEQVTVHVFPGDVSHHFPVPKDG